MVLMVAGPGVSSSRPDCTTQHGPVSKQQSKQTENEFEAEQAEAKKHFFTFCSGALSVQPSLFPTSGFLDGQGCQ